MLLLRAEEIEDVIIMKKSEFYKKWLESFAQGVAQSDMEKHVTSYGNFIWHVFSWELIDTERYLEGESARKAYDKIKKDGALYINWDDDEAQELVWPMTMAQQLDKFIEVYVVAPDFSWTYIKTHEYDCGPYFMEQCK